MRMWERRECLRFPPSARPLLQPGRSRSSHSWLGGFIHLIPHYPPFPSPHASPLLLSLLHRFSITLYDSPSPYSGVLRARRVMQGEEFAQLLLLSEDVAGKNEQPLPPHVPSLDTGHRRRTESREVRRKKMRKRGWYSQRSSSSSSSRPPPSFITPPLPLYLVPRSPRLFPLSPLGEGRENKETRMSSYIPPLQAWLPVHLSSTSICSVLSLRRETR